MGELQTALEDYQFHFRHRLTVWARPCLQGTDEYLIGRLRQAIEANTPIAADDYTFDIRGVPGRVY